MTFWWCKMRPKVSLLIFCCEDIVCFVFQLVSSVRRVHGCSKNGVCVFYRIFVCCYNVAHQSAKERENIASPTCHVAKPNERALVISPTSVTKEHQLYPQHRCNVLHTVVQIKCNAVN